MTGAPFIIYGLPRSRTFWLSRFLTYSGWTCGHDEARHVRSLADVRSWLGMPLTGFAETAAAPWWRLVQDVRPDIRTVVVRRPVDDVVASFARAGVSFDPQRLRADMRRLDAKLDQIERRVPGALSVSFDSLADEAVCARVFQHCLGLPQDPAWYRQIAGLNLQVDLFALGRYAAAFAPQMATAAGLAKQHILATMARRPVVSDAFTFQQEPLDGAMRDAEAIMAEHARQVGEDIATATTTKNLDLLRLLEQNGALQVTTARSNGRVFGYLLAVIGPSLEGKGKLEAQHTAFCAASEVPGLGLKLQRASIEALRARGVDTVFLRAGVRGAGPRMGALYRRLGAAPFGEMHRLDLKGAA